ncbi:MAG: S8 family serine peptidase, partial [Nanoarchaeota archaeon]
DKNYSDHLDIISLSLGGSGSSDDPMSQAIDNAVNNGVVAVVAAGNSGPNNYTILSPGVARKSITVGASNKSDVIAKFSSCGPSPIYTVKPDLTAPGVDICAAEWDDAWSSYKCLDNEHVAISGTSMATPHVSGASALILEKYPELQPDEVKSLLSNNAKDIGNSVFTQGAGRIDVLKSIKSDAIIIPNNIRLNITKLTNKTDIEVTINIKKLSLRNPLYYLSSITENPNILVYIKSPIIYANNSIEKSINLTFRTVDRSNIPDGIVGGVILFKSGINKSKTLRVPYSLIVNAVPPIITSLGEREVIQKGIVKQFITWVVDSNNFKTTSSIWIRKKGTDIFEFTPSFTTYSNSTINKYDTQSLQDGDYEYYIYAVDDFGLESIDDNKGKYYTFTKTPTIIIPTTGFSNKTSLQESSIIFTKKPEIDLDNDGKKEIIMSVDTSASYYTNGYSIYENIGNDMYSVVAKLNLSNETGGYGKTYSLDVGDADKDNKNEVLMSFNANGFCTVRVYESENVSSYPLQKVYNIPLHDFCPTNVMYADLDNDSKPEMVFSGFLNSDSKLIIYENIGDNNFTEVFSKNFQQPDYLESSSIAEDLDNDGKKEVIHSYTNSEYHSTTYVFENAGDNALLEVWSDSIADKQLLRNTLFLGDLDNDGKKEFIVGGYDGGSSFSAYSYRIYESVGDNSFKEAWSVEIYSGSNIITTNSGVNYVDVDNDGNDELIIQIDFDLYVFKNADDDIFEPIWYTNAASFNPQYIGVGNHDNDLLNEIIISDYYGGEAMIYEKSN